MVELDAMDLLYALSQQKAHEEVRVLVDLYGAAFVIDAARSIQKRREDQAYAAYCKERDKFRAIAEWGSNG